MNYFFVKEKYLDDARYSLGIGDGYFIGSLQEAIILGPMLYEENSGKAKFSPKSIIIPACEYVTFVNVIDKAYRSFEGGEVPTPWDMTVYQYSKVHHLKAKFELWDGEKTLKFGIKWEFANDCDYSGRVAQGSQKPIDTSQLGNQLYLYLKRGVSLKQRHVEVLRAQMPTILGMSFHHQMSGQIMGFVDGVMSNENLRSFLTEKMEEFKTMSYQSKMDILICLLDGVYKDSEGPLKNDLLFLFGNKVMLIFSLLSHYLKQ